MIESQGKAVDALGGRIERWWESLDHRLVALIAVLAAIGLIAVMASSPVKARRLDLEPEYFVFKQALFMGIGVVAMIAVSSLGRKAIFRSAAAVLALSWVGIVMTLLVGVETQGAQRWLALYGGHAIQPSEFAKPALIVALAWILGRDKRMSPLVCLSAAALSVAVILPIAMQPDLTQAFLIALTAVCLFMIADTPRAFIYGGAAAFVAALFYSYLQVPYATRRIDAFISGWNGDASAAGSQTETAARALEAGGLFGVGAGAGDVKQRLPDAYSDFIFAVMVEEFGALVCLAALGVYFWIAHKMLFHAAHDAHRATRLALTGLGLLFGLQMMINVGVNIGLLPVTGINLPLISYGGSSMLSTFWLLGMGLAFARHSSTVIAWLSPEDDEPQPSHRAAPAPAGGERP